MTLVAWSLAAARAFAVLRAHPLLRAAVGPWWWPVALGLAAVLAVPMATRGSTPAPLPWAFAIAAELALGSILGWMIAVPAHAAMGAVAASAAALRAPSRSLTMLGVAWMIACALVLGLHHPLLGALAGTLDTLPLGDPSAWWRQATTLDDGVVRLAHAALVLALALATVVLLPLAIVDLATHALARDAAPVAATAHALAPTLRAAAALVALGASWAAYGDGWGRALG